ncbi:MAG: NAD-binding protein, partial [Evtepia sp.]
MSILKILIVGAGKVGATLADHLSGEQHDVLIIDNNEDALRRIGETLDVMCLKGNGASPAALRAADVATADMVIATTSMDEVNMLCSLTAKHLGAKYTIARIRDVEYTSDIA